MWDSSSRRPGAAAQPAVAPAPGTAAQAALELKERGNALLKAGQCLAAVECYSEALALCLSGGGRAGAKAKAPPAKAGKAGAAAAADRQLLATLYSNRAHCLNKLQQYQQVCRCCQLPAAVGPLHAALPAVCSTKQTPRPPSAPPLACPQAAEDATVAHRLHPTWPKPLARLATAHLGLGQWAAAVAACKLVGERRGLAD